jgi:hypothetical protein
MPSSVKFSHQALVSAIRGFVDPAFGGEAYVHFFTSDPADSPYFMDPATLGPMSFDPAVLDGWVGSYGGYPTPTGAGFMYGSPGVIVNDSFIYWENDTAGQVTLTHILCESISAPVGAAWVSVALPSPKVLEIGESIFIYPTEIIISVVNP